MGNIPNQLRLSVVAGRSEAWIQYDRNGERVTRSPELERLGSASGTMSVAQGAPLQIRAALLDGEKVDMKLPAGIQSGEQLRHRGAGMSVLNGRGRGDLVARILVETPTRMSAKQKKLLEEFRATETGDECPATKSFFGRVRDFLGA